MLARTLSFHLLVLLVVELQAQGTENAMDYVNEEDKLYKYLLEGYVPQIKPEGDGVNGTVEVKHAIVLLALDNLDEERGILSTHVWERMKWQDSSLSWNKTEFNGLDTIRLPIDTIWKPDLTPFNVHASEYKRHDTMAVVYSSGIVWWVPPAYMETTCDVDLTEFPYDEQTCEIQIGSWTYNYNEVRLSNPSFELYDSMRHSLWDLSDTGARLHLERYGEDVFNDVIYHIKMRRRVTYINHIFVAPACLLALLLPIMFLLPAEGKHKINLGSGLLVAMVLLLMLLQSFIPGGHSTVPHIGRYYLACLILTCVSLLTSILSANIWSKGDLKMPIPEVARVCLGILGRILCVSRDPFMPPADELKEAGDVGEMAAVGSDDRRQILSAPERLIHTAEWRQLAVLVDRVCLVLFIVVVIVVCSMMIN